MADEGKARSLSPALAFLLGAVDVVVAHGVLGCIYYHARIERS